MDSFRPTLISQFDKGTPKSIPSVQTTAHGKMRVLTLNRPEVMNALTIEMNAFMTRCLVDWENSKDVNLVILKGNGRALCAGGDLTVLSQFLSSTVPETRLLALRYFQQAYRLDCFLAMMSTPVICLVDGIAMGGGLGLVLHVPFRLATENTRIAFPENSIGAFSNVGAPFFLPKMDGELGTYFGLTGTPINGWEAYRSGLASHYISSSSLAALQDHLSMMSEDLNFNRINDILNKFSSDALSRHASNALYNYVGPKRQAIDHCFKHDTIESIISELQAVENGDLFGGKGLERWAKGTKEKILSNSPSSCKISLMALRKGKTLNIKECFEMDLKSASITCNGRAIPDFSTGIKHRGEKKKGSPAWQPGRLEDLNLDYLRNLFFSAQAPPSTQFFPLDYISTSVKPYTSYPHIQFSLPSEEVIKSYIPRSCTLRRTQLEELLQSKWLDKTGVKDKIGDVLDRLEVGPDGRISAKL